MAHPYVFGPQNHQFRLKFDLHTETEWKSWLLSTIQLSPTSTPKVSFLTLLPRNRPFCHFLLIIDENHQFWSIYPIIYALEVKIAFSRFQVQILKTSWKNHEYGFLHPRHQKLTTFESPPVPIYVNSSRSLVYKAKYAVVVVLPLVDT